MESLDELFEEYQSANKNPADSTLEEGMQKVIKWEGTSDASGRKPGGKKKRKIKTS